MFKSNSEVGNIVHLLRKTALKVSALGGCMLEGLHPQTGEDVDHWGCAVTWLPMLTIENSQQQRQTGAVVMSHSEMRLSNQTT